MYHSDHQPSTPDFPQGPRNRVDDDEAFGRINNSREILYNEAHASAKGGFIDYFECDERCGFIRKVLGIVSTQLGFTLAMAWLSSNSEGLADIMKS
jgi:hypothetical protein